MGLNETPRANQLHITLLGKRNSGKSSLINAITGQDIALVSPHPGTTADPVYKSMEIHPLGPCVLIDTAGFDDEGELGFLRVEKTKETLAKTDIAILLLSPGGLDYEKRWIAELKKKNIPFVPVINKGDLSQGQLPTIQADAFGAEWNAIKELCGKEPLQISAKTGKGIEDLKKMLMESFKGSFEKESITGHLVEKGDLVLLVMPQDLQAPKGRLILPQVQTIRDLLDRQCVVVSCTTQLLTRTLETLAEEPKLMITDSQAFKEVYEKKPESSLLTSFSVLFAEYKGDVKTFIEGAGAIDKLTEQSKVLIAEACTHAPLSEDIGRVKIPAMLRKKYGENLTIDMVSGSDFPKELKGYDLIIHCGACMFNRQHVLSRIAAAKEQGIAITNYGIVMAKLMGILDKVSL
ncbi:MAG: [FeFe] hydrogenase H-cluster maturation GTPase HydF [Anaerovorax sp.]